MYVYVCVYNGYFFINKDYYAKITITILTKHILREWGILYKDTAYIFKCVYPLRKMLLVSEYMRLRESIIITRLLKITTANRIVHVFQYI